MSKVNIKTVRTIKKVVKKDCTINNFIIDYLKFVVTSQPKVNVTFIIGDCGAGKTSYATRIAQKEMKKGNPVYSNMYIKDSYVFDISDFLKYEIKDNATIIFDEAGSKGLASRGTSYKESNAPNVIEGFTMYRHYGIKNIIVIAPSFADVIPIVRSRTTRIRYICKTILLKKLGIGCFKLLTKKIDIPMGATEPVEVFKFIPFIRGFYFQYPTFKQFDSFSRRTLVNKNYNTW